jgi:colanic acid/amylovoran biosynthesis protein
MQRILMIGHGGYYNRGCEAIVRCTATMLRERFPASALVLASYDPAGDLAHSFGLVDHIVPHFSRKWTPLWGIAVAADRLKAGSGRRWRLRAVRDAIRRSDLVLSIGGDNYCYGELDMYYYLDDFARRHEVPVVLWGASVETEAASSAKLRDLSSFDLITARESITVGNLARIGISSTVKHSADPAFLLPSQPVDIHPFWPKGDGVLGLNISPLAARYHQRRASEDLLGICARTLQHAIDKHRVGVVIIPHVTEPMPGVECWNDDLAFMKPLVTRTRRPGRVGIVPPELNAMEMKYVISKCRYFIGARTHSTISALSQGIPTVSMGYSVKAHGINIDLFGHSRHVCDVRGLQAGDLSTAIDRLVDDEKEIRDRLKEELPRVRERALRAVEYLADL